MVKNKYAKLTLYILSRSCLFYLIAYDGTICKLWILGWNELWFSLENESYIYTGTNTEAVRF